MYKKTKPYICCLQDTHFRKKNKHRLKLKGGKKGILMLHLHQWIDYPNKKINKEILDLNDTLDLMNIIDINRKFHPQTAEYTLFSSVLGIVSKTDHTLRHKTRFNQFNQFEIILSIFPYNNGIKLKINCKKKIRETQIRGR